MGLGYVVNIDGRQGNIQLQEELLRKINRTSRNKLVALALCHTLYRGYESFDFLECVTSLD